MATPELGAELAARVHRAAPVGMALITEPGTIEWANPAYFEMTGRGPAILGTDFHDISESDGTWSPEVRREVEAALRDGRPTTLRSIRALHRTGVRPVYLDVDVRALEAAPGQPRQAVLLTREVTDRVEEHRRAALFYASFLASTNPMQLTDAKGMMVDVNPAFERTYGYTRAECLGRTPRLVRSRYTAPEVYETMWKNLRDPEKGFWSGELLNRDRFGHERPVLLSITAIRDGSGPVTHYLGVAVDLSEKLNWEMRAAHADKLASLGQLAAGVAHEINTPLANIVLIAESVRRRSEDPWVASRLQTLGDQVEVAATIVRGLLDFARREPPKPADLDLVEVVRSSVEFLKGKQPADVTVVEEYPTTPTPVRGDRGQLAQVVINLLNNATDAMRGSGTVRVTVRADEERVRLEVADSGPGIPDEVLPHIFEPFFTTKPEGEGTGLGLAICHGIIQSHHGSISAETPPSGGAVFRVTLPRAAAGAAR